jgi:hypothetical protein
VKGHECCGLVSCGADELRVRAAEDGPRLRSRSRFVAKRGAKAFGWVGPSAILVLMPKCPACVAAYVLLVTGAGVSVSTAADLRWTVLVLCVAVLVVLAGRLWVRLVRA